MSNPYAGLSRAPIKLADNRVWRTYTGGRYLEKWKGKPSPQDGDSPEQWVASTVQAKNVGREHIVEGLSVIEDQNGRAVTLKEVIESDPSAFLGFAHAKTFGANPAVLVKLLDAGERLTIQVHPDPEFAMKHFRSRFGKTESWYVVGGRTINGEEPYVLLGFKPHVTKELWRKYFDNQDIQGMIEALHKIPVREGDVFLVEGGVPHAIGSGCFLIEVQEPTDLTLRTERTTPSGVQVPDQACHQGLGFERMLDCFHYDGFSYEETLKRWKKSPSGVQGSTGGTEQCLIGVKDTERFSMSRLTVSGDSVVSKPDRFCIAIITGGVGRMVYGRNEWKVRKSEEWFLPAGIEEIRWVNDGPADVKLQVVLCYAPQPTA